MRFVLPILVILGLMGLVMINAGGGKQGLEVGKSILLVVVGLVVMAALFALLVTKPVL